MYLSLLPSAQVVLAHKGVVFRIVHAVVGLLAFLDAIVVLSEENIAFNRRH